MSFETIGEVLQRVVVYHIEATDYYAALRSTNTDERSDMLLHQLATQQQEQATALQAYLKSGDESVLSTELQFSPARDFWKLPAVATTAAVDLREIAKRMYNIDNKVLQLYLQLKNEQLPPRLEELFTRLAEQQDAIARMHSFDAQEVQDL